jgi:hypothetical protein
LFNGGINQFYVEIVHDAILNKDCFKIIIDTNDGETLLNLLKGVKTDG